MGRQSTGRLFLTFGALTLILVVAIGAALVFVRFKSIRAQAENDAAAAVSGSLTPVLDRAAGDLGSAALASFTEAARGLLSDQVLAIRLWSNDGEFLASTGAGGTAEA